MLESMARLIAVLEDSGRTPEARPLYEESLIGRRANATGPNATPGSKAYYARWIAESPFEDLRDVGEAVRLATAAAEETGHADAGIPDTLALALAAAGRREEAAAAQRQALALLPPDAPNHAEYESRLAEYSGAGEPPPK
jgi:hypothetical protein